MEKKNLCSFVIFFFCPTRPFPAKPQLEHTCKVRYRASPSYDLTTESVFLSKQTLQKAFQLQVCSLKEFSVGEAILKPFPSLTVITFFPLLLFPYLGLWWKLTATTLWKFCYVLTFTRWQQGQVRCFDTQVFACNYQVVLQVAEAQHISRGYDETAPLLA